MLVNYTDLKYLNGRYSFYGGVADSDNEIDQIGRAISLCKKITIPSKYKNHIDESGFNFLHIALFSGNSHVVHQLLDKEKFLKTSKLGTTVFDIFAIKETPKNHIFDLMTKLNLNIESIAKDARFKSSFLKYDYLTQLLSNEKARSVRWLADYKNIDFKRHSHFLLEYKNEFSQDTIKPLLQKMMPKTQITGKLIQEIIEMSFTNNQFSFEKLLLLDVICTNFKDINNVRKVINITNSIQLKFQEVEPSDIKRFFSYFDEIFILKMLNSESNEYLIEDCVKMFRIFFNKNNNTIIEILSKEKTLKKFHDKLMILHNNEIMKNVSYTEEIKFDIKANWDNAENIDNYIENDFHFIIPKNNIELMFIGKKLHNCAATYSRKMATGNSLLICIKVKNQHKYLLEIVNKKIKQSVKDYDLKIEPEILNKIKNILLKKEIISQKTLFSIKYNKKIILATIILAISSILNHIFNR